MENKAESANLTYEEVLAKLLTFIGSYVTISVGAEVERPYVHVSIIGRLSNARTREPTDPHETICFDVEDELQVPVAMIDFDRATFRGGSLERQTAPPGQSPADPVLEVVTCTFGALTYSIGRA